MVLDVRAARAEAVFASHLQAGDKPDPADVQQAITATVRTYRSRGCAERVAQEFGDHPDTAVQRMAWARDLVAATYIRPGRQGGWSRRPWRPGTPPRPVGVGAVCRVATNGGHTIRGV